MEIKEKKFSTDKYSKLYIPVHEIPHDEKILDSYAAIFDRKRYPEFFCPLDGLNINNVLRYIVLLYDPHTPFDEIIILPERKMHAAIEAGFTIGKNGRFPLEVEKMITGANQEINAMIFRYLYISCTPKVNHQKTLMEFVYLMQVGIAGGDYKDTYFKNMTEATSLLTKYAEEMLKGDTHTQTIEHYYRALAAEPIELRPEDIAKKLSAGEDIIFNYEQP
jgi:hypothetical protein